MVPENLDFFPRILTKLILTVMLNLKKIFVDGWAFGATYFAIFTVLSHCSDVVGLWFCFDFFLLLWEHILSQSPLLSFGLSFQMSLTP